MERLERLRQEELERIKEAQGLNEEEGKKKEKRKSGKGGGKGKKKK